MQQAEPETLSEQFAELDRLIDHLRYLLSLARECAFDELANGVQADIDAAEAFRRYIAAPWALRQ